MYLDSPAATSCLPAPSSFSSGLPPWQGQLASWPQPPERLRGQRCQAACPGMCRVPGAPSLWVCLSSMSVPHCLTLQGCLDLPVFGVVPVSVCISCLVPLGQSGPACHVCLSVHLSSGSEFQPQPCVKAWSEQGSPWKYTSVRSKTPVCQLLSYSPGRGFGNQIPASFCPGLAEI